MPDTSLRSIATTTLPGNLLEKMQAAAGAGFDGIEIFENDLTYFDSSPSEVRDMAAGLGLTITALQPFRDFEALPPERRRKAFDRAARKFDLMAELGTDTMLICSNVSEHAIDDAARAAADLHELAERAATRGLKLGYEALAWGRHVKDWRAAWDLVARADHPQLGLVLDTFHIFCLGDGIEGLDRVPVSKIALVQLADAPRLDMDPLELSRHFRCFPGQGDYPVVEFYRTLRVMGYRGAVSQEIFSDEFRAATPLEVARDGMRSLIWLGEQAATVLPPGAATGAARTPVRELFNSVEFVEFATEGREEKWLDHVFGSLGFRKTHVHASKAVSLYRQGDISFVVNSEPDSFARAFREQHGLGVCAIGLGTARLEDALERAERFRCQVIRGRAGPGELDLPALREPGGTLIHLVERTPHTKRFFDVDFRALEPVASAGPGQLERVDHLARAVSPNELLSEVLLYRTVFGFEPSPKHDLVGPHGVIVSRTMTSANRAIQIPLNASHAQRSSTERFRQHAGGSGVQHIALTCSDIFAFARRMPSEQVLRIARNYYEDLEARFNLDAELLGSLQRYNILYDEDDAGQYFQLYTRASVGMFFEVIERRGYAGFGAANAAARMAAQEREYRRVAEAVSVGTVSRGE